MKAEGNKAILSFDHIGSVLTTVDRKFPQHFAITGSDSTFVWGDTKMEGNKVIVWSDKIDNPIAVRNAWAENPEDANQYNEEAPGISFSNG